MEWKVVYVGSAENSSFDQVLDEIVVGPVPVGTHKFILETDAPDLNLIPRGDLLGITVLLVTCSYREQEFARVGYYVKNEYIMSRPGDAVHGDIDAPVDANVSMDEYMDDDHELELDLDNLDLTKVVRTIVADKPRVTRFPIQWSGEIQKSEVEQEQEHHQEVVENSHIDSTFSGDDYDYHGHVPLDTAMNISMESIHMEEDGDGDDDNYDYHDEDDLHHHISLSPLASPEKIQDHSHSQSHSFRHNQRPTAVSPESSASASGSQFNTWGIQSACRMNINSVMVE